MTFLNVITEPAILIITAFFMSFILIVLKSYDVVEKNLRQVLEFLKTLNKKEVSYKFNQIDQFTSGASAVVEPTSMPPETMKVCDAAI